METFFAIGFPHVFVGVPFNAVIFWLYRYYFVYLQRVKD